MPVASTAGPFSASELRSLRARLLRWCRQHRRDLPWRRTRDPYCIWVSEIMLQQTRVSAVLDHYARFVSKFPTVKTLAEAAESDVLAAWSGLGYYRRARAMHRCAKALMQDFQGSLPRTPEQLRSLPGIGAYTSAAIASIAFEHPAAVVDGNVERVLTRLLALRRPTETVLNSRAESLLARRSPGDWNQAMMELGATICTPLQPHCEACPLSSWCRLPGGATARLQPARNRKQVMYGLSRSRGRVRLVQRPADVSLMPGMWELPQIKDRDGGRVLATHKHSITVTDYEVTVIELPRSPRQGVWVELSKAAALPLTGLARKVLRNLGLLAEAPAPNAHLDESN